MPETLERAQVRLHNISIVKPLLEALKTISLGSWQASQRAIRSSDSYRARLMEIMPHVATRLKAPRTPIVPADAGRQGLFVVIGSERGLCGNFNRDLGRKARLTFDTLSAQGFTLRTIVFGKTAGRILQREFGRKWEFEVHPMPSVPPSKLAGEWSAAWLKDFNRGAVDRVEVIYNQNVGAAYYKIQTASLIPIVLPEIPERAALWPELYCASMAPTGRLRS